MSCVAMAMLKFIIMVMMTVAAILDSCLMAGYLNVTLNK